MEFLFLILDRSFYEITIKCFFFFRNMLGSRGVFEQIKSTFYVFLYIYTKVCRCYIFLLLLFDFPFYGFP